MTPALDPAAAADAGHKGAFVGAALDVAPAPRGPDRRAAAPMGAAE